MVHTIDTQADVPDASALYTLLNMAKPDKEVDSTLHIVAANISDKNHGFLSNSKSTGIVAKRCSRDGRNPMDDINSKRIFPAITQLLFCL